MINGCERKVKSDLKDLRDDCLVENIIVEELCIFDRYPYSHFLKVCFRFAEEQIAPLSSNEAELKEDLRCAKLFVEGDLKEADLLQRNKAAAFRLRHSVGIDYEVQKFMLIFLEWNFLCDVMEEGQQNDHVGIFFELLYEIKEGLCVNFLDFLIGGLRDKSL